MSDTTHPPRTRIGRVAAYLPASLVSRLRRLRESARRYLKGFLLFLLTLVGHVPSHVLRRFAYRHLFGVRIGRTTTIHWQTRFFAPSGVRIGNHCVIGSGAFLDGRYGLTLGDRIVTGSDIMIYTAQHDIDSPSFAYEGGPVIIEDLVYLGPRVIILPQVHIGEGAVVCAGAVVTRDVEPYTVVGGVPARFIRRRSNRLDYFPDFQMPFQ